MEVPNKSEKRFASRFICWSALEMTPLDSQQSAYLEGLDLSLFGMGLWIRDYRKPLRVGQAVSLCLPNHSSLPAEVRWCHGPRAGVMFRAPVGAILSSWVGELLSAQGRLPRL